MVASALVLFIVPIWILSRGEVTAEMATAFAWLLGLPLTVIVLIHSCSLERAYFISAFTFAGLVVSICVFTGGVYSFAIGWLLVIPVEAVLLKRRWAVMQAAAVVVAALGFLMYSSEFDWFGSYETISAASETGFLFGPMSLIIYMVALTLRVEQSYISNEMQLKLSEERYKLLSENTIELITQHSPDGKVTFASQVCRTLFGVAPGQICGNGLFDRVHIADRPVYLKLLSDVIVRGLPFKAEFRVRTTALDTNHSNASDEDCEENGFNFCWMEMHCRPIWESDKMVAGIVATTRDISERRNHQEELERAHLDLQQLNDAKSRFLANMSHELRTPLNAIIGFSEILQQETWGPLENEKYREYVGHIHASGAHLLQVVTDILDMSKIESGSFDIVPETFDVEKLLTSCVGIMSQQAEAKNVRLVINFPEDLPQLTADPRACRQIVLNLLSNAIKFSSRGDCVTISARVEDKCLAFAVKDEGIGIGPADLERVGQPFFQADASLDRRYEGTGLGVSVVKGLTELHKGRVQFESELNKGTCVTVFIPLVCEASAVTIPLPETQSSDRSDLSDVELLIKEKARKLA